jgi:hypothetical protein
MSASVPVSPSSTATLAGQYAVRLPGDVGLAYNVDEPLRFMIEGRYFGTTNPSVSTPFGNVTYQNQNILATMAGVTYKFVTPRRRRRRRRHRSQPPVVHGVLRLGSLEPVRAGL